MGKYTIYRGSSANDGTGDNLRLGAQKINDNFTELYTALGDGSTLATGTYITTSSSNVLTNKTITHSANRDQLESRVKHLETLGASAVTGLNGSKRRQTYDEIKAGVGK